MQWETAGSTSANSLSCELRETFLSETMNKNNLFSYLKVFSNNNSLFVNIYLFFSLQSVAQEMSLK